MPAKSQDPPASGRRQAAPNGAAPKGIKAAAAAPPPPLKAEKAIKAGGDAPTDRTKMAKGGKPKGAGDAPTDRSKGKKGGPQGAPLPSAQATGAAAANGAAAGGGAAGAAAAPKIVSTQSKVQYWSEELLSRKPLDSKLREQLMQRCGKPQQEVSFTRNEAHRPPGRPDESVASRHERVPPAAVVLMFNCHHASFDLLAGDLSTLPEAETIDLKSLTR